jgi:hypothetical protein
MLNVLGWEEYHTKGCLSGLAVTQPHCYQRIEGGWRDSRCEADIEASDD